MRIPNLYLGKHPKSFIKTQKIKRTISPNKPYIQKACKQEAEMEQELQAYIRKQKETEKELTEKMNNALMNIQAEDIYYNVFLFYGIRLNKEKIIEILKARKAK